MSATSAIATQALKSKSTQRQLEIQLGLVAATLGANPQRVGQQVQKSVTTGKMRSQTVTDHGVKFHVGTTLSEVYLFVTR